MKKQRLFKIFALSAACIAGVLSLCVFRVSEFSRLWIPLVLWLGIWLVLPIPYFLLLFLIAGFVRTDRPVTRRHPVFEQIMTDTTEWLVYLAGARVTVEGGEQLDPSIPHLFVANHRSQFDPMVCMAKMKEHNIAFISKPSNFKIPIAGKFIHMSGFLPIDRSDIRSAARTIRYASEFRMAAGRSVGIYPEGTRSRDGSLLPFHDGVFQIAMRAKAPIAVLHLERTANVAKNFPWHRTFVTIRVLSVLKPEDYAGKRSGEISAEVRAMLEQAQAQSAS